MSNLVKLDDLLASDILSGDSSELIHPNHFSRYYKSNSVSILTFRELEINNDSLEMKLSTYILKNLEVYSVSFTDYMCTQLGTGHVQLLSLISEIQARNTEILSNYIEQTDLLEDWVYDREVPRHFMDMWFEQKKCALKIVRYYERLIPVLKDYWKDFKSDRDHSDRILEKMKYNLSQTSSLISKLDSIHHYYTSVKSDRLNKNIYFLTLISGIFLPLNLIVGFFGMNTENLIFKDQPQGTVYVLYLLGGVVFASTLGLRLLRVADNILLRYGLGRYKLYEALSKKIQKVDPSPGGE